MSNVGMIIDMRITMTNVTVICIEMLILMGISMRINVTNISMATRTILMNDIRMNDVPDDCNVYDCFG